MCSLKVLVGIKNQKRVRRRYRLGHRDRGDKSGTRFVSRERIVLVSKLIRRRDVSKNRVALGKK